MAWCIQRGYRGPKISKQDGTDARLVVAGVRGGLHHPAGRFSGRSRGWRRCGLDDLGFVDLDLDIMEPITSEDSDVGSRGIIPFLEDVDSVLTDIKTVTGLPKRSPVQLSL